MIIRLVFLLINKNPNILVTDINIAVIDCEGIGDKKCILICNKFKYDNMLCIQRPMLHVFKHSCLSCVPTATSIVPANTYFMSTDYSCASRHTGCLPTDTTCIRCFSGDSVAYLIAEIISRDRKIIS